MGTILKDVPYVSGVAGVILQIIKIRDVSSGYDHFVKFETHRQFVKEIKTNKERCAEVIETARDHTTTLLRILGKLSHSPQRDRLEELEDDLLRYKRFDIFYF